MNEKRIYELDLDQIKRDFKFSEESKIEEGSCNLTHSQCKEFKLLPYVANDSKIVSQFNGVIGAFSRFVNGKELKNDFNSTEFIENVVDEIGEFEGTTSKEAFRDIIKTMFINKNNLVDFDIKTLNYISSTNSEEKVAKFLYSVFLNRELKKFVKELYERDVDNILYKLVLKALPEFKEKEINGDEYKCYLPFVKELFIKDFKFLISNEELYKNSIKRFLEYYNMFYISQLTMKLSFFEKADLTKPESLYYTLGWESISKNRTAYMGGWQKLNSYTESLFSHVITLEFLNHNNLDEKYGYTELFELFETNNEEVIADQIDGLCNEYIGRVRDWNWDEFKERERTSGNKAFDKVYKLFDALEYQFEKPSRNRAKIAYKNWFERFVFDNFSKRRGSLGYSLNLSEEDIIFLTKICINNNEKLKLGTLFEEFEKRGISFDRDSKAKIIQLYEKLNLLEKKSDSGDAQYVRSIL